MRVRDVLLCLIPIILLVWMYLGQTFVLQSSTSFDCQSASKEGTSAKRRTLSQVRKWNATKVRFTNNNSRTVRCSIPIIGVLTTILPPSEAVVAICDKREVASFPTIVIADRKGPAVWPHLCKGITYITVEEQKRIAATASALGRFVARMPWNHFGRKNIGYLLAVQAGACRIWDFDDDNILLVNDLENTLSSITKPVESQTFGIRPRFPTQTVVNPYTIFSPTSWLWPRGVPIELVATPDLIAPELIRMNSSVLGSVAVIQSAADGNPDVDAMFRLTRDTSIYFQSESVDFTVLSSGFSPYNAQATLHLQSGFWALYLPITVPGRVSDIWRAYCAEAVFSLLGLHAAFTSALVRHDRSPHDLVGDLKAEDDLYQLAGSLLTLLGSWIETRRLLPPTCSLSLWVEVYVLLYEHGILEEEDIAAVTLWAQALDELGASFCAQHEPTGEVILSPPQFLEVPFPLSHAAVHVNHDRWRSIGPWHATFGAQFGSVSFHVQLAQHSKKNSPLPQSTFFRSFSRPFVSGDDSYVTLLEALQHVQGTENKNVTTIWLHDDAVLHPLFLRDWLQRGKCAAIAPYGQLDSPVKWYNSTWTWQQRIENRAAALVVEDYRPSMCESYFKSQNMTPSRIPFFTGQSDALLLRTDCANVKAFAENLRLFAFAGMFLEIAVPTAAKCSFEPGELDLLPLFTIWDASRDNETVFYETLLHSGASFGLYHPVKCSSPQGLMTTLRMRDLSIEQLGRS